jgi:hypothetical protein
VNRGWGPTVNSVVLGIGKTRRIPCLSCGYDITGLERKGVCPECAFPLKDTLEASALLRGWPPALVRRIRLGVYLLAMSPAWLFVGLAVGLWIGIFMAASGQADLNELIQGTEIGLAIGCGLAAVSFVAGCELVTRAIPARPLHPAWARVTLRVAGPLAALATCMAPFAHLLVLNNDPWATLLIRLVSQAVVLTALIALIRVCQSIGRQTQAGVVVGSRNMQGLDTVGAPRNTGAWSALVLLALVWIVGYWVLPLAYSGIGRPRFGRAFGPLASGPLAVQGGGWGAGFALIALIIMAGMLWRLVDVVSLEWTIAKHGKGKSEASLASSATEPSAQATTYDSP